ncbi:non-canonical purine NTP pyrophosphatase [Canibacter oris]|uniref:dITP/XTP pyrophosphatase n=1 Tax=Canibacter oris TaxID=1365628 RepID=A0A840DJL2_9MICO|nr:non-canonical purine NTP pyrophosphatase [Canibacter oris]MBB4071672.1 XTP/dITP diphosphohydrolase [Canibacter oris]
MSQIVLASRNAHKLAELERVLGPALPGYQFVADDGPEPVENGTSFAQNALLKARAAAQRTGQVVLADDSGIAVDILGGSPGIFSARWAGPQRSDNDNLELLLWQLQDVPDTARGAAFVCAAAAVLPEPNGEFTELTVVAEWPGEILRERSGEHGFGYDPIFRPAGFQVSAAQLEPAVKDSISHRFRAFSELAPKLAALLPSA